MQRFTRDSPCPICSGQSRLKRGTGERCVGFWSGDRRYAYCTREERAGSLPVAANTDPPAYAHRLAGRCGCGVEHGPAEPSAETSWTIRNGQGQPLALHVRYLRDGEKGYAWRGMDGSPRLPAGPRPADMLYGAELLSAPDHAGQVAVLVEGEKAADAVRAAGLLGIGTVTGAGSPASPKALGTTALALLHGRPVVLWPDNDPQGIAHMQLVGRTLVGTGPALLCVDWPDAPTKADAADCTPDRIRALVGAAVPWSPAAAISPNGRRGARFLSGSELLALPDESVPWVVVDLIAVDSLNLVVAKPKVGKSTLVRFIAHCVACGEPVLGRATRQSRVLYVAIEDRLELVGRHFRSLGTPGDQFDVVVGAPPLRPLDWLATQLTSHTYGLVVVDPLVRFLATVKDVIDYAEMSRILGDLGDLARVHRTPILTTHHAGKVAGEGPTDAPLGSTAFAGAVDTLIVLSRGTTEDAFRTIATIQRSGPEVPQTVLSLHGSHLSLGGTLLMANRERAEAEVIRLLSSATAPLTEADIKLALERKGEVVQSALRSAARKGVVVRAGGGKRGDPYLYRLASGSEVGWGDAAIAHPPVREGMSNSIPPSEPGVLRLPLPSGSPA